ncbi:MAG: hypothetical protein GOU98_00810 [Candidatus Altiarchaeota archaeon]|nr:hypothetical protein [Candidatus Altiarchaeota archaeon]
MAGIITLIVFVSGFSVGMVWDQFRTDKIRSNLDEISIYSTSLFLESQLLEELNCPAFLPVISGAVSDISKSLDYYTTYSEASVFGLDEKNLLYRRYLLSNIRYWRLADIYKRDCGWNSTSILYFFDKNCEGDCDELSTRLDYLKRKYGEDLLIFPVNMQFAGDDPVALTLLRLYNITSFPSIVIEGVTYGNLELSVLEGLVCQGINC